MPCAGALDNVCMRTLLYFIENPEEEFTGQDMREKFSVHIKHMPGVLRPLIERQFITYTRGGGPRPAKFTAGPKLRPLGAGCTTAGC